MRKKTSGKGSPEKGKPRRKLADLKPKRVKSGDEAVRGGTPRTGGMVSPSITGTLLLN